MKENLGLIYRKKIKFYKNIYNYDNTMYAIFSLLKFTFFLKKINFINYDVRKLEYISYETKKYSPSIVDKHNTTFFSCS